MPSTLISAEVKSYSASEQRNNPFQKGAAYLFIRCRQQMKTHLDHLLGSCISLSLSEEWNCSLPWTVGEKKGKKSLKLTD